MKAKKKPIVCIVVGMAGSGKTRVIQRINSHCFEEKKKIFTINLDPAVPKTPYGCHIDICKTVNYNEVMKQFNLGPNGCILTSLNLFSTKFDQVVKILEKKEGDLEYVFIDTPGQIEIFTWSASGRIITECLASTFPTCLIYVVDTPRSASPLTFMSNMLYACSILYKFQLPFLILFNKTDVKKHEFAVKWMKDYDEYSKALQNEKSYSSSLAGSMSLVLEEFYENISTVGFSAMTGEGLKEFFGKVDGSRKEYEEVFLKEFLRKKKKKEEAERRKIEKKEKKMGKDLEKLEKDLKDRD